MKKQMLLGSLALLAFATVSSATLVIDSTMGNTWTVNQDIPDANPAGIALSHTFSGLYEGLGGAGINAVDVHLNLTGGFNGDLYGYLVLQNGSGTYTSILLNRVGREDASGFGFSTGGFGSIVLSSAGGTDIHTVTSPAGGTYSADGRTVNPNGDFSGPGVASRPAQLNVFTAGGISANGTWTLFLADLSGGDVSHLVSWGLDVSVVPEPTTWALIGFVALLAGGKLVSLRRRVA